ncbi:MAG TPA: peroxiredoxin [Terriglobales bacterium]|nr:peroxiredoxin [Terriglobales bacterium]
MVEIGSPFPSFSLPNEKNEKVDLAQLRGKWIALFVYPKDDTPGCTIESKGFSAAKSDFEQANAVALGISADDSASHQQFCDKHGLTVSLLADPNGELLRAGGVGQTDWHGTMYWDRTTFLIDPQGILRKVYKDVKPTGHEQQVLNDIRALSAQ